MLTFGIQTTLSKKKIVFLAVLPFALAVAVYLLAADLRHRENPNDKLLPQIGRLMAAIEYVAFTEDARTGKILLVADTTASLKRLFGGVLLATATGLFVGLCMGMVPVFQAAGLSFVTFISMVPPLAILPILFISFGVGELAKIMLIFIGVFPVIARDIHFAVKKIPQEEIVKAFTLGASDIGVIYRMVLPQVVPKLLETVRLSLGAAWLFLIAAEAIASTDGLGYRIFLVRRYMAMDIILPYVLWITMLGFLMDFLLKTSIKRCFVWYGGRS